MCFYLVKISLGKIQYCHIFTVTFLLISASLKRWKLLKQESTFYFGIKDNEHTS